MTPAPGVQVDRAAAVRAALRTLVAERGFHGASMSAVADLAGVATGTAYTHYASKDELVLATYEEVKHDLGAAVVAEIDPDLPPRDRFIALWLAAHRHLAADPTRARFLRQVDSSPFAATAHARVAASDDDPLVEAARARDIAAQLAPLPLDVLFDLGLGPAVRLAANGPSLPDASLRLLAAGCWAAITICEP